MNNQNLPGDSSLPSSKKQISDLIHLGEKSENLIPVEDFFRKPDRSGYSISPDGKRLAFLGLYHRRQNILVQPLESDEEAILLTKETDRGIAGFLWANEERIIYVKDQAGDENFQLFGVDVHGSEVLPLTPFPKVRVQLIDDLKDDRDHIIIGMNKNNPQLFEPYRINVYDGTLTQLGVNDNVFEPIDSWMTDHQGKLRLATKIKDGVNTCILYRDSEEDEFQEVITTHFKDSLAPGFFHFEQPHWVYVLSNLDRDKTVAVLFDMKSKQEVGDVIFQHDEVDVSHLMYSRKRKVLTAASFVTDKRHYHFIDSQRKALHDRLGQELGDAYEIVVVGADKEENNYLVRTYSDRSRGSYYHYNVDADLLRKISDVSPWLDESEMAPMLPISYTSRDGLKIHGYLTLPHNHEGKRLPVVINPHGGPWVRDMWGYNPEVQLLASRGFAVLQMNYRGSTGYGKRFWEASFKQWGKKMQDDITDGVLYLIQEGIANSEKVAIYGGSYGGYATLAGVTFTPDLYACAIDYVGVSNLFTFMKTMPPYWKPYIQMMYEMVGDPVQDKELMESASPVFHVDRINAPLMVIQGANDPRVNIDESDQIVKSLRARSIDVPYLVKYDEGHGFHNEENQFEVYKAIIGFLKKHLD